MHRRSAGSKSHCTLTLDITRQMRRLRRFRHCSAEREATPSVQRLTVQCSAGCCQQVPSTSDTQAPRSDRNTKQTARRKIRRPSLLNSQHTASLSRHSLPAQGWRGTTLLSHGVLPESPRPSLQPSLCQLCPLDWIFHSIWACWSLAPLEGLCTFGASLADHRTLRAGLEPEMGMAKSPGCRMYSLSGSFGIFISTSFSIEECCIQEDRSTATAIFVSRISNSPSTTRGHWPVATTSASMDERERSDNPPQQQRHGLCGVEPQPCCPKGLMANISIGRWPLSCRLNNFARRGCNSGRHTALSKPSVHVAVARDSLTVTWELRQGVHRFHHPHQQIEAPKGPRARPITQ
ncbi:hypothetical protein QBC39DRAFT_145337 [Podospora conica]|nr:hypothetical protein QBC39DRAFT_145337 [Schizothecium conicum]